jgi:hypothetical protein
MILDVRLEAENSDDLFGSVLETMESGTIAV